MCDPCPTWQSEGGWGVAFHARRESTCKRTSTSTRYYEENRSGNTIGHGMRHPDPAEAAFALASNEFRSHAGCTSLGRTLARATRLLGGASHWHWAAGPGLCKPVRDPRRAQASRRSGYQTAGAPNAGANVQRWRPGWALETTLQADKLTQKAGPRWGEDTAAQPEGVGGHHLAPGPFLVGTEGPGCPFFLCPHGAPQASIRQADPNSPWTADQTGPKPPWRWTHSPYPPMRDRLRFYRRHVEVRSSLR